MFPFPTDLSGFAVWLGTAGAGGVLLSLLLERIPAFKNWGSKYKSAVVIGLFLALPFISDVAVWALGRLDAATLAYVQGVLGKALFGLIAWGASQYGHKTDPAAGG